MEFYIVAPPYEITSGHAGPISGGKILPITEQEATVLREQGWYDWSLSDEHCTLVPPMSIVDEYGYLSAEFAGSMASEILKDYMAPKRKGAIFWYLIALLASLMATLATCLSCDVVDTLAR